MKGGLKKSEAIFPQAEVDKEGNGASLSSNVPLWLYTDNGRCLGLPLGICPNCFYEIISVYFNVKYNCHVIFTLNLAYVFYFPALLGNDEERLPQQI